MNGLGSVQTTAFSDQTRVRNMERRKKSVWKIAGVLVAIWCAFWWGHYAGFRSANMAELSAARSDLQFVEQFAASGSGELPAQARETLLQNLRGRAELLESAVRPSLLQLVIAPVGGPIGAYWLAETRRSRHEL